MSIDSEIRARNIRAKLMAEKRSLSKAGAGQQGSRKGAKSAAPLRGDGINRAALWRKAMGAENTTTAERPAITAPKAAASVSNVKCRNGKSHAEMWCRAHEQARLLPPIRGGE